MRKEGKLASFRCSSPEGGAQQDGIYSRTAPERCQDCCYVPGLLLHPEVSGEGTQETGRMPGLLLSLKGPITSRLQGELGIARGRRLWEGMPHRGGAHRRSTADGQACGPATDAAAE